MFRYASIYTDANGSNCSNDGISSTTDRVYIAVGEPSPPESYRGRPVVTLKVDEICGEKVVRAFPVSRPPQGWAGWMYGGSWVCIDYTGIAGTNGVPKMTSMVRLMDRAESPELFELCSK